VAAEASPPGDAVVCSGADGAVFDVPPDSAEHPAVASAKRQVSPAADFRKLRMAYPLALVISVSGRKQKTLPEGKRLTPAGP
jgi:hypothetical protein